MHNMRDVQDVKQSSQFFQLLEWDSEGQGGGVSQFDAELALKTPGLQPPMPGVVPLDTVTQCRRLLPPELPESFSAITARNMASSAGTSKAAVACPLLPPPLF